MVRREFEVVILGGGLSGLTLALQLRKEAPSARVLVLERSVRPLTDACHKVGESSVELASHYLGTTLGLEPYLRERHLVKNGLRFFPGGGTTHAVHERTEIGPPQMPKVPSFQLDRGRLEGDLRQMAQDAGVTLEEGWVVREVALADEGGRHVVHAAPRSGGDAQPIEARWVVDASGWQGLLRKQRGLTQPSRHEGNAAWWRVSGRIDVADLVPRSEASWHAKDPDHIRWLSTVHFMGEGYWVWLIPLATGHTSVGIVVHDSVHPFDTIRTYARAQEWLRKHEPVVAAALDDVPALDFLCVRHYSHATSQSMSAERWALTGPAGAFADPLYSPGSDFIALANSFISELVRRDLSGEDIRARAAALDAFYVRFFDVACETYRHAAPVYARPVVMAAKIYFDDFNYWAFACQYFFQGVFRLSLEEQARFADLAAGFAELNLRAQPFLAAWARRATSDTPMGADILMPTIPSVLANLHLELELEMDPAQTRAYMAQKLVDARELLGELVLRALLTLGRDEGLALAEETGLRSWGIAPSAERVAAEDTAGGKRRRALSSIARDLERSLGRAVRHPSVASGAELAALVAAATGAGPSEAALMRPDQAGAGAAG